MILILYSARRNQGDNESILFHNATAQQPSTSPVARHEEILSLIERASFNIEQ